MAAKIAIGRRLDEMTNPVTRQTTAAFEPALDYVVVKIPRWPFDKFSRADRTIGTQMKATGEVMAIDRSFEGALHKAVRSLESGAPDLVWEDPTWTEESIFELVQRPNDIRLWAVVAALRRGAASTISTRSVASIAGSCTICSASFTSNRRLEREELDARVACGRRNARDSATTPSPVSRRRRARGALRRARRRHVSGLQDGRHLRRRVRRSDPVFLFDVRGRRRGPAARRAAGRRCRVRADPDRAGDRVRLLAVQAAHALHDNGVASIMINSNPETVSTDFDASDRLYFEPLDEESVAEVLGTSRDGRDLAEVPVIVQFGGQTAINLAGPLASRGVPFSAASSIRSTWPRIGSASRLSCDELGIPQPPGRGSYDAWRRALSCRTIGYPVLVRPSYVLGGRAMEVVYSQEHLARYIRNAAQLTPDHPVLIDKYLWVEKSKSMPSATASRCSSPGSWSTSSGPGSTPAIRSRSIRRINLFPAEVDTIVDYTDQIAPGLERPGADQYPVCRSRRTHLRARSQPPGVADGAVLEQGDGSADGAARHGSHARSTLAEQGFRGGLWPGQPLVAVKAPVFSMAKLRGVDTHLGPEMKSTGEVMGIDRSFEPAFYKALACGGASFAAAGLGA